MRVRHYFAQAPIDERKLDSEARRFLNGKALTTDEIAHIYRQHSIELATRALYLSLTEHQHRTAIERIDAPTSGAMPVPVGKRRKLLIAPGLLYREFPEIGADGVLVKNIADTCGLEAQIMPLDGRGALSLNADKIRDYMQDQETPFWLFSVSKGSGEVRFALDAARKENAVPDNLRGWINLCGITSGTPMADRKVRNTAGRTWARLWCSLARLSYQGLNELATTHPRWSEPFQGVPGVAFLHVAGMPVLAHVQAPMLSRWKYLSHYGPNDGMALLSDLPDWPGTVYPLWGLDHMMRSPQISWLCYRIFHALPFLEEQQREEISK